MNYELMMAKETGLELACKMIEQGAKYGILTLLLAKLIFSTVCAYANPYMLEDIMNPNDLEHMIYTGGLDGEENRQV